MGLVAPGLYEHEKKFALPLIVSSIFFLVVGIGFAYLFVLPAAYKFFFAFASRTGADVMQDLQKYWDFTLAIFFGFGLTFRVPVAEMLLVKLGMVTTEQLRAARRYVVVGAFIVAAVLTPPGRAQPAMLAIPLILLYELGIVLAGFHCAAARPTKKKRRKRTRANGGATVAPAPADPSCRAAGSASSPGPSSRSLARGPGFGRLPMRIGISIVLLSRTKRKRAVDPGLSCAITLSIVVVFVTWLPFDLDQDVADLDAGAIGRPVAHHAGDDRAVLRGS